MQQSLAMSKADQKTSRKRQKLPASGDPGLLRSQKLSAGEKAENPPEPVSQPTQSESISLLSGELRSITLEKTNDKEWDNLTALIEVQFSLTLDQQDLARWTMAAIAALRNAHDDDWKAYCENRGIKWRNQIKSPFQPLITWILKQAKARTGENHSSKASMIAGCLDEYWEIERPSGMTPDDIPAWLESKGGYTKVYRDRLERVREPKDKRAERYSQYLKLPPREKRAIPEWLNGFDGEVLISAHVDRAANKLDYRAVCKPKGSTFWYRCVDQFLATRPEQSEAADHLEPSAEPANDDISAPEPERGEAHCNNDPGPSANDHLDAMATTVAEPADSGGPQTQQPEPEPDSAALDNAARLQAADPPAQVMREQGKYRGDDCHHPSGVCGYGHCLQENRCVVASHPDQKPAIARHAASYVPSV